MDYTYEFVDIRPKDAWVQIRYSADGKPDILRSVIAKEFDEVNLNILANSLVEGVFAEWERKESAPDQVVLDNPIVAASYKPKIEQEPPAYDESTQNLIEVVSETSDSLIQSWQIVDKSDAEKEAWAVEWRTTASVSMRQARLALKQQGLLATVQSNIDALSEDSQIEWEYAAVVERKSPLVASLGTALGLTETQLDDLFKLAITI